MAHIHHPQLNKTVEVPDKSVLAWEGSGWEEVDVPADTTTDITMTVEELTTHLGTVDDVSVIETLRQIEIDGKARSTALDAIAAREAAITST